MGNKTQNSILFQTTCLWKQGVYFVIHQKKNGVYTCNQFWKIIESWSSSRGCKQKYDCHIIEK